MAEQISGYAIRYNEPTTIAGMFIETIAPGAFDQSLRKDPDVLMLMAHDPGRVIGRTTSGTLSLRSDRIGMFFTTEPDPSAPDGAAAISSVSRQDIAGCSFGFLIQSESWDFPDNGELPTRTIERAQLLEVSLVGWPAYESTSARIANRSEENRKNAQRRVSLKIMRANADREAAMRRRGMID